MTPLSIIVARSKNNVIGFNNTIPWSIPEDMRFFKETTMSYPVIMGRNTWLSFNGKPLPGRMNIVISQTPVNHPQVYTFKSLREAHEFVTLGRFETAFVIGGQRLYDEAMATAIELFLTQFDFEIPGDTFFDYPSLDDPRSWHKAGSKTVTSISKSHPNTNVVFERYVRVGI